MEKQYLNLLQEILDKGEEKGDRTGTGTLSLFGRMYRHDLKNGIPLLTTKKMHVKSIIHELLWFLSGSTNIQYLKDNGVKIWDGWATPEGEIGPMYGAMWTNFPGPNGTSVNQVSALVEGLRNNPNSRRHIIDGWHAGYLPDESMSPQENVINGKQSLAPCHNLYQFSVRNGQLSAMLTQRSGDALLGVPYNAMSVSLFVHMLAQQCNLEVGEIVHSFGDIHLYKNHLEQARLQVTREPRKLPELRIKRKPPSIFEYRFEDFEITGYDPHPAIKAEVSI